MRPNPSDSAAAVLNTVTGAILAGGRGLRMGGHDKGMVPLIDRPLVHWVLDAIRVQVDGMLVVANRNLAYYAALGVPVVSDLRPHYQGPLAGLETALHACPSPWMLSVPCDAVAPPPMLARRLLEAAKAARAPAAYATADGHAHYVCCLLSRELAPQLSAALDAGESAPRRWLASLNAVAVDFTNATPAPIWSINTQHELTAAAAALERH